MMDIKTNENEYKMLQIIENKKNNKRKKKIVKYNQYFKSVFNDSASGHIQRFKFLYDCYVPLLIWVLKIDKFDIPDMKFGFIGLKAIPPSEPDFIPDSERL